ncbi:MAG: MarR family transcriptional regulator [Lachnospiraceae bacterium]
MSDINTVLNEILVRLFKNINAIEEGVIKQSHIDNMTTNDMHVIEAIGNIGSRNMTSVAKSLMVTTGTLTISVNSLVKKGYVVRERSEEDRRVVLVSLSEQGLRAFDKHKAFHDKMVQQAVALLSEEEKRILAITLGNLNTFFRKQQEELK